MTIVKQLSSAILDGGHVVPALARMAQESALRKTCVTHRTLVLTYDDGPGPILTSKLLGILTAAGQKAVFFALGSKVAAGGALLDRIIAEGHELGCHGRDHVHAWQAWPWEAVRDVNRGYDAMNQWIGPDAIFRPPYGKMTLATWIGARRRHRRLGWWTVDSGDTYATLPPDPDAVAAQVQRAGGGVVLMHDFDRQIERMDYVIRATQSLLEMARRESIAVRRFRDLWLLNGRG